MKMLIRCLLAACLCLFALPAFADEKGEDYEKDARYAESTPPMVPHRIDEKTSEACLACHRTGVKGAPVSPHPIRLDCTQCHGQGEIKADKSDKKDKKSRKQPKQKE